jgi:hypothetical protein
MSNSVSPPKLPLPAERQAPAGAALDMLVDKILGRAVLSAPGHTLPVTDGRSEPSNGLPDLNARLPPAAIAAQAAREAAAQAQAEAQTEAAPSAQDEVPGAVAASALIDEEAGWLPADPERREAFLQVFRFWHSRVRPQYASQATPAFLYLVTALPVLIKARDELKADRLWEPKSDESQMERESHPAWKKYCEFLPRAQQASAEIKSYRTISLVSGLDDLFARVTAAEKMYRQP